MSKDIKFSVIIPTYNSENYIMNCLNCVKSQTYKNFEILCIDDCSTDLTHQKLNNVDYIRLFKTAINSKQGTARNIGLDNAIGDYIVFIDDDDTWSSDYFLENLYKKIMEENEPDIIYFGLKTTGERKLELIPDDINTQKEYRLSKNKYINVVTICWKRNLLNENNIRFPEKIRYEDVYFNFLGIEKAKTFSYIPEMMYLYNNRAGSTTTTYTLDQAKDTIHLIEKLINLYDLIDKKYYKCLDERIMEQSERCNIRLNRAIENIKGKV